MMRLGFLVGLLSALALASPAPAAAARTTDRGAIADRVLADVQAARRLAALPPITRRGDLDLVAHKRAQRIAALPAARRLALREPIDTELREAGISRVRRATMHLDLQRGHADPGAAFCATWRGYAPAWSEALDPRNEAIGIAIVGAPDGWLVLVAVLVEQRRELPGAAEIAAAVFRAINAVRLDRGLLPLAPNATLDAVARAHSEDMVRRQYFAHRSPGGETVADRVRLGQVGYRRLAENLHANRGMDDPAAAAIEGWMASPEHRDNILEREFTQTGIGVALSADGEVLFTQIFLAPVGQAVAR